MIDGDWDPDLGDVELRFDDTFIDDLADIVEFYRAHGPQVPEGATPLRTQRVAAALAHRCDLIIDDMVEYDEEMDEARERQRKEMDEDEASDVDD